MLLNNSKSGVLTLLLVGSVIAGAGAFSVGGLSAAATAEESNDTRANATTIEADSTVSGTVEADDVDWYAVEIEAGQGIYGKLTITTDNDENLQFDIFSPDGKKINEYPNDALQPAYETNRVGSNSAAGGTVAEQSGTYYVRVKGADEGVSKTTSYDLTITSVLLDEYDPNEQPAQATALDIKESVTVSGAVTGYDRDTYAIKLDKGETVTITYEQSEAVSVIYEQIEGFSLYTYLAGPNASDATLNDYYKGDDAVASQQVGGPNKFTYTATTSGTYYLRIVPFVEASTIDTFAAKVPYNVTITITSQSDTDTPTDTATPSSAQTTTHSQTAEMTQTTQRPTQTTETTQTTPPTTTETTQTTTYSSSQTTTEPPPDSSPMTTTATTTPSTPAAQTTTTTGPGFGVGTALAALGGLGLGTLGILTRRKQE